MLFILTFKGDTGNAIMSSDRCKYKTIRIFDFSTFFPYLYIKLNFYITLPNYDEAEKQFNGHRQLKNRGKEGFVYNAKAVRMQKY